jgi:hypothetical protein
LVGLIAENMTGSSCRGCVFEGVLLEYSTHCESELEKHCPKRGHEHHEIMTALQLISNAL